MPTIASCELIISKGSNENGRNLGERLAVNPHSPNQLYFGWLPRSPEHSSMGALLTLGEQVHAPKDFGLVTTEQRPGRTSPTFPMPRLMASALFLSSLTQTRMVYRQAFSGGLRRLEDPTDRGNRYNIRRRQRPRWLILDPEWRFDMGVGPKATIKLG